MEELFERLNAEGFISMSAAAKLVRAHPTSVARWCHKGTRTKLGVVKLEHVRMPGRLVTSAAALARFFAAIGADPVPAPPSRSPAKVRKASEEASRALEQMGI